MATITQGMFGMTPEDLMAQRQQALNAQALQYAQLDPAQAAQMSFYKAGSQLGSGLGGLMGAQDPELMRVRQRQQMLQGIDLNDPDSLMKKAQEASQMGDYQAAQELAAKAQALAKELSAQKLEAARAKYYEQGGAKGVENAKNPYGKIIPTNYTPDSFQAFDESVRAGTPNYSLLEPKDPVEKAISLSAIGRVVRDSGFIVGTPEFNTEVKRISEAERTVKSDKPLPAATLKDIADTTQSITNLESSKEKLDTLIPSVQKMNLGLMANWFRQGAAAVGVNTADRVQFDALRRNIIGEANNLLLLAKGTQTEGDAQRASAQIADENTWKNADALEAALKDLQATHSKSINSLKAREQVLKRGGQPASAMSQPTTQPAPAMPKNVDYSAAFERAKKLDPRWAKYTLEQFKQAAGAR